MSMGFKILETLGRILRSRDHGWDEGSHGREQWCPDQGPKR